MQNLCYFIMNKCMNDIKIYYFYDYFCDCNSFTYPCIIHSMLEDNDLVPKGYFVLNNSGEPIKLLNTLSEAYKFCRKNKDELYGL